RTPPSATGAVALNGKWQSTSDNFAIRIDEQGANVHVSLVSHASLSAFEVFADRSKDNFDVKSCYVIVNTDAAREQIPVGARIKLLDENHLEISAQELLPVTSSKSGNSGKYKPGYNYRKVVFERLPANSTSKSPK